ncbi:hypothetical protein HPB47_017450 [Ixodes persulcatus]|uniref:Uncharacterized protein n=1 Tax=Ixodes persulcatus TaxID=34615 RepID=A0AC60QN94_IXOPE|nr:hypothetical protein HPB47_017450 [Ixodes persulcatus]
MISRLFRQELCPISLNLAANRAVQLPPVVISSSRYVTSTEAELRLAQLKKCWGNLKQKWKNERSDEKRKTHKRGGRPPPTPMSAISVLVGTVAGHMATRLVNDNDSNGAYLPPVQNEPVVRLLEGMVGCNPEYERPLSTWQPVYGRRRARGKCQYRSSYRSSPGSPHRADHTCSCSCFKLQQRQGGGYSR